MAIKMRCILGRLSGQASLLHALFAHRRRIKSYWNKRIDLHSRREYSDRDRFLVSEISSEQEKNADARQPFNLARQ